MSKALELKLDPGFWTKTSWIQLMYGIWVNFATLSIGLAFGFPAVQVPQLSHPDSEVKITRNEASWIASVLTLFSPIGCLLSGYVIDRFGRRTMIIACQAPMCIGWLYTGLAPSAGHIIIGRTITGIGCGMAMGPPRIYSTEISLPNMRGVVGTFPSVALALGICIQAGLGAIFHWQFLSYACSVFTFMNLLLFNLLPETPYFLLTKSNSEHAKANLAKFRGKKYDLDTELSQLLEFKHDNKIRKLTFKENIERLFTRSACKPFFVINVYVLITQLAGINAILMWAIEILTEAKSSFNVETGNFMLAVTRLIVVTITSIMLFRVGRRPLSLISACGVSGVCFCLGAFIHYNHEPSIIPQLCFMAYMFFASIGYYTIPYLMMAELYPLQVRGTLGGITVSASSIFVFASSRLYPLVKDNIGLANTIIVFGINSLLGAIFLYYYLPETKELTLQEIEEYYNARRPTLVSQRRLQSMQLLQQQSNRSLDNNALKSTLSLKNFDPAKQSKLSLKDDDSQYRAEAKKKIAQLKRLEHRGSQTDFDDPSIERERSVRDLIRKSMMNLKSEEAVGDKKAGSKKNLSEEKKRVRRRRSSSLRRQKDIVKSEDMEGSEESTDEDAKRKKDNKGKDTSSEPGTSKKSDRK